MMSRSILPLSSAHSVPCPGERTLIFYILRQVKHATNASVQFGLITNDHWVQPGWVNETKAQEGRKKMEGLGIPYAGMRSNSLASITNENPLSDVI
jgi:hypothetical protein